MQLDAKTFDFLAYGKAYLVLNFIKMKIGSQQRSLKRARRKVNQFRLYTAASPMYIE